MRSQRVSLLALVALLACLSPISGGCGLIARFTEIHRNVLQRRIARHPQELSKARVELAALRDRRSRVRLVAAQARAEASRKRRAAARMGAKAEGLRARCKELESRSRAARRFADELRAGRARPVPGSLVIFEPECRMVKAREGELRQKVSFFERLQTRLGGLADLSIVRRLDGETRAAAIMEAVVEALTATDLSFLLAISPMGPAGELGSIREKIASLLLRWEAMRRGLEDMQRWWASPETGPLELCRLASATAQDATALMSSRASGQEDSDSRSYIDEAMTDVVAISIATCAIVRATGGDGVAAKLEAALRPRRDLTRHLVSIASLTGMGSHVPTALILRRRHTLAGAVAKLAMARGPSWTAKAFFSGSRMSAEAELRRLRPILQACARSGARR
ncbi:MAG: hypothetical protein RBU30_03885 [Polyangia bacterium]|jgi:hypothetical protein|nr:hypothetical protein [Polyangia bacterium]